MSRVKIVDRIPTFRPASEPMKKQFFKWSPKLKERTENVRGENQIPRYYHFSPSISSKEPKFLKFKVELYKNFREAIDKIPKWDTPWVAPDDEMYTIPKDVSALLNVTGSFSYPYGYLYGNMNMEYFEPEGVKRFRRFIDNLNLKFEFKYGLIKRHSSSGLPVFTRDIAAKTIYLQKLLKTYVDNADKIFKVKDPTKFHEQLLELELLIWFVPVVRLQPDSIFKARAEVTAFAKMVDADKGIYYLNPSLKPWMEWIKRENGIEFIKEHFLKNRGDWYKFKEKYADSTEYPLILTTMRRRTPYGGSHFCLGFAVLSHGVQDYLTEAFPNVYHIGDSVALEDLVNEKAKKWGRVFFAATDLKHFEYSFSDWAQRIICEELDKILPEPYNHYKELYMHSGVTMWPRTPKDAEYTNLFTSRDYFSREGLLSEPIDHDYRYPLRIEGNNSGQPFVAVFNKIYGAFLMIEALNQALGLDVASFSELEKHDIHIVNNGDDGLFLFRKEEQAKKFQDYLTDSPELYGVTVTPDLPSFNAIYLIERRMKGEFVYTSVPSFMNMIYKYVTAEYTYGLTKDGPKKYPNLGMIMRLAQMSSYNSFGTLIETFFRTFRDVFGFDMLDEFPLNEDELLIMNELDSGDTELSQSLWEVLVDLDPDRLMWDPRFKEAPQELRDKYYVTVDADNLDQFLKGEKIRG